MDYKQIKYSSIFIDNNGQQNRFERVIDYDDKRNPSIIAVTNKNGSIKYESIKTYKPKNKKTNIKSMRKPKRNKHRFIKTIKR